MVIAGLLFQGGACLCVLCVCVLKQARTLHRRRRPPTPQKEQPKEAQHRPLPLS